MVSSWLKSSAHGSKPLKGELENRLAGRFLPVSDSSSLQVAGHQWKILGKQFSDDFYKWGWVAKIKNNSAQRSDIYVEYHLLDKSGMRLGLSNENTNIGPGESGDVTGDSYIEGRLLKEVSGSRVFVADRDAGQKIVTPIQAGVGALTNQESINTMGVSRDSAIGAWTDAGPEIIEGAKKQAVGTWTDTTPSQLYPWVKLLIKPGGMCESYQALPKDNDWGKPTSCEWSIFSDKYADTGGRYYAIKIIQKEMRGAGANYLDLNGRYILKGSNRLVMPNPDNPNNNWALTKGDIFPFSK